MEILAKSNPRSSLKNHINDALEIFEILKKLFPRITEITDASSFWDALKTSIIFHDIGKSHLEFQKVLLGKPNQWNYQRHELFSLPFIESLNIRDKDLIYHVVAGHHKDYSKLIKILNRYGEEDDDFGLDLSGIDEIPSFEDEFKRNIPIKKVLLLTQDFGFVFNKLNILNPRKKLQNYIKVKIDDKKKLIKLLLLAGAFKQCDHLASAGIKTLQELTQKDFKYLYQLGFEFYSHQKKSSKKIGNAILTAPTGAGKTESALLWLKNQIKVKGNGRVFYILPFTASINAMFERLEKDMPGKTGMVHGKLAAFIENKFGNDDLIDEHKKKEIKEQFENLVTPLKVVTPFQLLKHIFTIKGFEKGIFEWTGGYFIFDEIHAYNPKVFAQIIVLLEFVIKYLNVKVFIMTATLPKFLRKELENVIVDYSTIEADNSLYRNFVRHRIIIKKGRLDENIKIIQDSLNQEKKVLVVCNTVKQAQFIYKNLKSKSKVLLHSSFNAFDRNKKEQQLFDESIKLLVGTQAIEVSLDIDYDIIYTEPAPLDALIQRFGRVNRKREKGISDCIVFEERNKSDKFIYKNKEIIKRTLKILKEKERVKNGVIIESELQEMIDFVYPTWNEADKEDFDKIYSLLNNFIDNDLKPFVTSNKQEEDFYDQFDGVKVLPIRLLPEYEKLLEQNKFIKAENLKVQISEKRFFLLNINSDIEEERTVFTSLKTNKILEQKVLIINKKYDSELGLMFEKNESESKNNFKFL